MDHCPQSWDHQSLMEEKTLRRKKEKEDPGPTRCFVAWKSQALPLGCCGDPTGNRRNPTGFPHSLAVPRGRTSLAGAKALGNAAAPQNLIPSLFIPSLCPAHSSSLQKHHTNTTPSGTQKLESASIVFLFLFLIIFKIMKLSLAENKQGK